MEEKFLIIYLFLLLTSLLSVIMVYYKARRNQFSTEFIDHSRQQSEHPFLNLPQAKQKNKRGCFRLDVDPIPCEVTLDFFGNQKLLNLKGKVIDGYVHNISLSGLKIASNYELPVRSDISVIVTFTYLDTPFTMNSKIVRREDHINKQLVYYGLEFTEISHEERKILHTLLNKQLMKKIV